ncbi:MAG: hypothetical protein HYX63_01710 [Gammaproteobacteria bacterium]|nr:hypothetical protein [Gammaproteobacteria bacterium]
MMNAQPIEVLDDLTLIAGRKVVAHLLPSQALDLAEVLVRSGMRRILFEEGADALLADEPSQSSN